MEEHKQSWKIRFSYLLGIGTPVSPQHLSHESPQLPGQQHSVSSPPLNYVDNRTNIMMKQSEIISIASTDHQNLLDTVDSLRSLGLSRYVALPQLIVCGDQSSGKSSVLEAVSGLQFPMKDNLCTRYATELILRRHSTVNSTITIIPDASRDEEEKTRLSRFKAPCSVFENFAAVTDAAAKAMGIDNTFKVFSTDVLRIEISGPKQPHLTLVDLPGFFHSGNKEQSVTDAFQVTNLVTSYMENPRSVILAVVSAKNDLANQIVIRHAEDCDPEKTRTLGIITKPDTLDRGSTSEAFFLELAQNQKVELRQGWHVLKNRDYHSRKCSLSERAEAEATFLGKEPWCRLRHDQRGIDSLRSRLGQILQNQILTELPNLVDDVENGIDDCKTRLARLGTARGSIKEQRKYLHHVGKEFARLIEDAIGGHYSDEFFDSPNTTEGYAKRLRAVSQNNMTDFAKSIRTHGHKYHVVDNNEAVDYQQAVDLTNNLREGSPPAKRRRHSRRTHHVNKKIPTKVTRSVLIDEVHEMMKRSRGRELPGTYNPEVIIADLFHDYAEPWTTLVKECADVQFDAAKKTVTYALEHVSDQVTAEGIFRSIIIPALDSIKAQLDEKVAEIMKQHQHGHPITFNHYFTDNIQRARQNHAEKNMAKKLLGFFGVDPNSKNPCTMQQNINTKLLLAALTSSTEADMDKFACSEALDCMLAYYAVAMKFMIDDFGIHVIEEFLLKEIPKLFTSSTVFDLGDEVVQEIAGEKQESQDERAKATTKLTVLENALKKLKKLDIMRAR